jgi:hypothetical protein
MLMLHILTLSVTLEGNIQTDESIDCMNHPMMSFPLIYSFNQSHGWHSHFSDRILEWLQYSYVKKFHDEDKVAPALLLLKNLRIRRDMFLLDPPYEEVNEHVENCQEAWGVSAFVDGYSISS